MTAVEYAGLALVAFALLLLVPSLVTRATHAALGDEGER